MENRAGSGGRADDTPRRLNPRVAGPAAAAGAVSLGLVLIGSCGLGQRDVYVSPPPLQADLQSAPAGSATPSGTTAPGVLIPPSPSWRVAVNPPPRRTPFGTPTSAGATVSAVDTTLPAPHHRPGDPTATSDDPGPTTTTTRPRITTTRPTTTRPAPTTQDAPSSEDGWDN
ncbi:hypothetical protein [Nocardia wallacei]|uniref:hypothetical protein n=1 Tax=Nocardia wallacei TaxID=480035 RepID=UPI0024565AFF|nr:hypothetical protein [Nocardia wallacei]